VWQAYDPLTPPHYQLEGARFTVAGGWQAPVDLDTVTGEASHPALAVNAAGDGALVFRAQDAQGYFVPTLRRFSAATSSWSTPQPAAPSWAEVSGTPHVHLDAAGTVSILYPSLQWSGSNRLQRPLFVRQQAGAAFSSPIDVAAGLPNDSGLPEEVPHLTLAGSSDGKLVAAGLAGYSHYHYEAWARVWTPAAGTWSSPVNLGVARTGESAKVVPPSVAVAETGDALVAWSQPLPDHWDGRVVTARLYPSGQWATPQELEQPVSSSWVHVGGLEVPLCTVATDGSFHTAWARESSWPTTDIRVWTARFD
jgi:hypothetical protein